MATHCSVGEFAPAKRPGHLMQSGLSNTSSGKEKSYPFNWLWFVNSPTDS